MKIMSSNDDAQQSLPVIINNPDEKSQSATMNDLPNEILPSIFKHLVIKDLLQCRLVCKRFMFFCGEVKIPELIVSFKIHNLKDFWFHTNEQFNYKDAIDVATFKRYQSIFRLDQCLKRLYFKGVYTEEVGLNKLTNLEQLRLDVWKYKKHGEVIDLPNLKILEFDYSAEELGIYLTAPKLEMLKYHGHHLMNLTYPTSVRYLETIFQTQPLAETSSKYLQPLTNLQYWKTDFLPDRNILSAYPQLTTLVCNQFDDDEMAAFYFFDASSAGIRDLVEEKRLQQRHDLKIYYQSVEVVDRRKMNECESTPSILALQMNNYDSLCEYVSYDYPLDYNELMRLVNGELPQDFHKKYFNVKRAMVMGKVTSLGHLAQFLKSFDYLNELHLEDTALDQSFYDRLPEIGPQLTELRMRQSPTVNYDFLLKMKSLCGFAIDVDLLDLSLVLFSKVKHFHTASFYFGEENVYIRRMNLGGPDSFLVFRRKVLGGRLEKTGVNFDELVDYVNTYKITKSTSSNSSD